MLCVADILYTNLVFQVAKISFYILPTKKQVPTYHNRFLFHLSPARALVSDLVPHLRPCIF